MHEHAHRSTPDTGRAAARPRGFADLPRLARGSLQLGASGSAAEAPTQGYGSAAPGRPEAEAPASYRAPRWQEFRAAGERNVEPAGDTGPRMPEFSSFRANRFGAYPSQQQARIDRGQTPLPAAEERTLQWQQTRSALGFPAGPAGSRGVAAQLSGSELGFPEARNPVHAARARMQAQAAPRPAAGTPAPVAPVAAPVYGYSPATAPAAPAADGYAEPPAARPIPDRLPASIHAAAPVSRRGASSGRAWLAAAAAFAFGVIGMASFGGTSPAGTVMGGGSTTQPGVNLPYGAGGMPSPAAAESLYREATGGGAGAAKKAGKGSPKAAGRKAKKSKKAGKVRNVAGGGGAVTVPDTGSRDSHALPTTGGGGPAPEDVPDTPLPLTTPAATGPSGVEPSQPNVPF